MDKNDLTVTFLKSLFGGVPFIGTALNEVIFELRGRIKQKRMENFVNSLAQEIKTIKEESINFEYLQSDEFIDFFESIIFKVLKIKSQSKVDRFRKILIDQIQTPKNTDYHELFLEIAYTLDDNQIEILSTHMKYKDIRLQSQFLIETGQILNENEYTGTPHEMPEFREANYYNIEESEFNFYLQDMFSKSLLLDTGVGGFGGGSMFKLMEVTELGKRFLDFIVR